MMVTLVRSSRVSVPVLLPKTAATTNCLVLLLLTWSLWPNIVCVRGQFDYAVQYNSVPSSPCPETFQYEHNGYEYHGIGHIFNPPIGQDIVIRAHLIIGTRLPNSYYGKLKLTGSPEQIVNQIYNREPIQFDITFPVQDPLPTVNVIMVNDEVICQATAIPHYQYTTKVTLQYMFKPIVSPNFRPTQSNNFGTQSHRPTNFFIGGNQNGLSNGNNNLNTNFNYNTNNNEYPIGEIPLTQHVQQPQQVPTFTNVQVVPEQNSNTNSNSNSNANSNSNTNSNSNNNNNVANFAFTPVVSSQGTQSFQFGQPTPAPATAPPPPPQPTPPAATAVAGTANPHSNLGCGIIPNRYTPLVFGGNTINRGDWPFVAAIHYYKGNSFSFRCGSTIISKNAVISAAHCFHQANTKTKIRDEDIIVFLGHFNLKRLQEEGSRIINMQKVYIHPEYMTKGRKLYSDIAVGKLVESVEFSEFIQPACLWRGEIDQSAVVGKNGVVVGWGRDENGNLYTPEPKRVAVPIVADAECLRSLPIFAQITNDRTFCAGWRNGSEGPCTGDSGTGLMLYENGAWQLRGIVSSALTDSATVTCNLNEFVVFTDVAKFLPWIMSML